MIKQAKLDGDNGHCFCIRVSPGILLYSISKQEACIEILLEAQQLSEFVADSLIRVDSFLRQLFTENRSCNIEIIHASRIFNNWIRNSGRIATGQYPIVWRGVEPQSSPFFAVKSTPAEGLELFTQDH